MTGGSKPVARRCRGRPRDPEADEAVPHTISPELIFEHPEDFGGP